MRYLLILTIAALTAGCSINGTEEAEDEIARGLCIDVLNFYGFDLDENAPNGTVVGAVPSNGKVSFEIESGNDPEIFGLNSETGELFVTDNSHLDHASTPEIELSVNIISLYCTQGVRVTVSVLD